jgi:four helix bundle protein
MFDFQKLVVYQKAKVFNAGIRALIRATRLDSTTNDQLRRAAFSVVLNLAEGSGRFSKPDRKITMLSPGVLFSNASPSWTS